MAALLADFVKLNLKLLGTFSGTLYSLHFLTRFGWAGNTKGGSITVPLTSCLIEFGISCMTTDNCCFYLQNRLIQTSQTGGQRYSDTSPFSFPWAEPQRKLTSVRAWARPRPVGLRRKTGGNGNERRRGASHRVASSGDNITNFFSAASLTFMKFLRP